MPYISKTDEFSEKFQTAFDPPLILGKSYCNFFPEFMTKVPFIMAKICNIIFLIENDPPPLSELFLKFIRFGNVRHPLACSQNTIIDILSDNGGSLQCAIFPVNLERDI